MGLVLLQSGVCFSINNIYLMNHGQFCILILDSWTGYEHLYKRGKDTPRWKPTHAQTLWALKWPRHYESTYLSIFVSIL